MADADGHERATVGMDDRSGARGACERVPRPVYAQRLPSARRRRSARKETGVPRQLHAASHKTFTLDDQRSPRDRTGHPSDGATDMERRHCARPVAGLQGRDEDDPRS